MNSFHPDIALFHIFFYQTRVLIQLLLYLKGLQRSDMYYKRWIEFDHDKIDWNCHREAE